MKNYFESASLHPELKPRGSKLVYNHTLNTVFLTQLTIVVLAALGILPREVFLFLGLLIVAFCLWSSLEDCIFFIARSIPLFVALPITPAFDSFNIWRIVVAIVFIRFAGEKKNREAIKLFFQSLRVTSLRKLYSQYRIELLTAALFIISALSLTQGQNFWIGAKRLVYFGNLGVLFFVVRGMITKENLRRFAFNITLSGVFLVVVGIAQLLNTYFMPIDTFAQFWALQVERVLYGNAWSNIVINANTWFAYYKETIHLRLFSSFPDSHSFPLYLLMTAVFILSLLFTERVRDRRASYAFLAFLVIFEIVLTGTRGIWASVLFPLIFLAYIGIKSPPPRYAFYLSLAPLVLFLFLLPVSSLIFGSAQFQLQSNPEQQEILLKRLRSIIDLSETSNSGRVYIWKETLRSIQKRPLLGVGIGNFPTILKQNPTVTKAGASAHNLYLHITAELGIIGFVIFILILYEILKRAWELFKGSEGFIQFFALNSLLYLIWILWYSMTDVAIFDERAFLLLMLLTGTLFALTISHDERTSRLR